MKIVQEYLNAVKVISLDRHPDARGYFMEIYSQDEFDRLGIDFHPVQDNCSHSLKRGTIRGLHFQKEPYAQAKLIRCSEGSFYDLAVDCRKNSPTYGKAVCIKLTKNDDLLVFIPKGFAHGVAIIEDDSEYTYKVDASYNGAPENNDGISCFYDPEQLNWDELLPDTELILSDRDRTGVSPTLEELDSGFVYEE
ncbi:MAG: dTDP-4-dehydrorhamnose 3,5-epimerase family protein [Solobacterium sp.]|nr:dTDP-4-dehydrorhamnose 3,5-epimerase family protein [Solobacterium sp.]